jgi:hypothetical protein
MVLIFFPFLIVLFLPFFFPTINFLFYCLACLVLVFFAFVFGQEFARKRGGGGSNDNLVV